MRSTRTLPSTSQSGAALLPALVIVAALASLAALMMETMRRTQRLDANLSSQMQAQWLAIGADAYARSSAQRLERSGELTALLAAGPLQAAFPLDQGLQPEANQCRLFRLARIVTGLGKQCFVDVQGGPHAYTDACCIWLGQAASERARILVCAPIPDAETR